MRTALIKTIFFIILLNGTLHSAHHLEKSCIISGKVSNETGEPLHNANIFLQGSLVGNMADKEGKFKFKSRLTGKQHLVCSYIGFSNFEQDIILIPGDSLFVDIRLKQIHIKGEEVMITASAFTAADEEGVTLSAMDVVRTPGAAADLFWAIKSFPGLQQVEEGAGLFVRGGDVSENVFLLDGAIINHPYKYESPTGGFFGTFSPFLLKGTFFSSGGFSARYGNALSGALVMESHDVPEQRRTSIGIGLAAESAYISAPIINNRLGFSFSGNRSNTKMLFELNNSSKNFSRYPFSYDLNLNMIYKVNNQQHVKMFIYRAKDKVGLEVDDPDFSSHFYGNSSNELYNLRYTNLYNNKNMFQANIALNRFQQKALLGVMNLNIEDCLYQARFQGEREIRAGITFRAGLSFFQHKTGIFGTVPINEMDVNPNALSQKVATDYTSNRFVQFIEMDSFMLFGIHSTAGIRAEYKSKTEKYKIAPRFTANYSLSKHSNLTASWGIFHQYPAPKYFDAYVGNPKLGAMHAFHYIFGYAFQKDNTIFRVESYYKKYKDLLLNHESLNYTNNGYGHATGLDVFIKKSYGLLSGWVSYSWLRARRKWNDIPVLTSPYFDIPHNFSVVMNIEIPKNFTLGAGYRFASGKPYTPAFGKYNESRVPSYQKLDLNFTYLVQLFEADMTILYISISNVLDRINIFDYHYSSDFKRREAVESSFGRSWYFGVQFNL